MLHFVSAISLLITACNPFGAPRYDMQFADETVTIAIGTVRRLLYAGANRGFYDPWPPGRFTPQPCLLVPARGARSLGGSQTITPDLRSTPFEVGMHLLWQADHPRVTLGYKHATTPTMYALSLYICPSSVGPLS